MIILVTPTGPMRSSSNRLLRISVRSLNFWILPRFRKTIFPETLTITGGSIPARLIRRPALSCTDTWGTFTAMRLILSGSRRTGQAPSWGWHSAPNTGLFSDAPRRRPGINLPSEFVSEFSRLDKTNDLKSVPRGSDSTFLFNEPGHSQFFGPKRLAPDTVAFANSLRDPVSASRSPLDSREYKRDFFPIGRSSIVHHRWQDAWRSIPPLSPTCCVEP